jgi:hypothetical protein
MIPLPLPPISEREGKGGKLQIISPAPPNTLSPERGSNSALKYLPPQGRVLAQTRVVGFNYEVKEVSPIFPSNSLTFASS